MIISLLFGAALAAEPPTSWSDLTPWRTWAVVDHVSPARHWFVLEPTPGLNERCEVGVDERGEAPVVHCGPQGHADTARRPLPRSLRKQEKRARAALVPYVGAGAKELEGARMDYLGLLSRVSFRQLVVTHAAPDPASAVAWTVASFWDVDLDTGAVDHGAIGSRVAEEPLCRAGLHARCEELPMLLDFVPAPGWEGHLIDVEADGIQATQTRALEGLVRQVALDQVDGAWTSAAVRETGAGVLPDGMEAGASLQLEVEVQRLDGRRETRPVVLDLPLNEAAFDGATVQFGVEDTGATVTVDAMLAKGSVRVVVDGPEGDDGTMTLQVRCPLILDDARAVLPSPCPIDGMQRSVTWVGASGVERVRVTLPAQVLPLLGPSRGPSVR